MLSIKQIIANLQLPLKQ